MDELRLALRRASKHRAASVASVLTLACAIAAVAATYSLVTALLLRPVPVPDAGRLVIVGERVQAGREAGQLSDRHIYTTFPQMRDARVFERVVAIGIAHVPAIVDVQGVRTRVTVHHPTYDFFDALGLQISPGRTFLPDDDRRGAPLTIVISERFWRRTLASDASIIGRTVRINDTPATIIGVAPAGFRGIDLSDPADVYMPLHTVEQLGSVTRNYFADAAMNEHYSPSAWVVVVGRTGAGRTAGQLASALNSLPPAAGRNVARQFGVIPLEAAALPARTRANMIEFAKLLGGTVGLLLLIGSVTVGMLLLVRTEARQDEFAMCVALGASRHRLAAGVACEGALLSLAGVVLAVPLTGWVLGAVRAFQLPGGLDLERLAVGIDPRAFTSAAVCALAAALVITALAGMAGFRANVADALRSRAGATPRLARRRTRALLVATQVAVALVLVAGSTLFVRSTIAALRLNPGFDTSHIVSGSVALPRATYDAARARSFFEAFQQRVNANPAVSVASLSAYDSGMSARGRLTIDGESREMPSNVPFAAVDDRYFAAMGMRIIEGRAFAPTDTEASPLVAIVSESYGRFVAHGASPIGHRITMPYYRPPAPPSVAEIVGVVPDVIMRVTDLQPFVLYFALGQQPGGLSRTPVVHVSANAAVSSVRRDLAAAVRELDPSLIPPTFTAIDEQLMRQMAPQRFGALVMGSLGAVAMLLTLLGAYVLSESMAVMRMRELGIRAALGATRRQLAAVVVAETGRLVGGGLTAGLFLAWMGANTIRSFLFHVAPLDPPTLALVAAAILSLALAVSLRPALRAARVDLARVLKQE